MTWKKAYEYRVYYLAWVRGMFCCMYLCHETFNKHK